MKVVFSFLVTLFNLCNSLKTIEILQFLDFSKLDFTSYNGLSYIGSIDDTDFESLLLIATTVGVSMTSQDVKGCAEGLMMLELRYFDKTKRSKHARKNTGFIKDPCRTPITFVNNDQELEQLLDLDIEDQPYFYAIKSFGTEVFELHEVQIYSRLIKSIAKGNTTSGTVTYSKKDIADRRSDFNGQPVRMVFLEGDIDNNGNLSGEMGETVLAFQQRFNFSIENVEMQGWGSLLPNGTWTGTIGQLMQNNIDVSPLVLSNSPSRIKVVHVGHAFGKGIPWLYYPRKGHESYSLDVMVSIFNADSRLVMIVSVIVLVTMLAFIRIIARKPCFVSIEQSIAVCAKAIFGQDFNQDHVMFDSHRKSKYMTIFTVSMFGALIYWHYTGVLISSLAAPQAVAPIKKLDDLLDLSNFKLYAPKGGETNSQLLNWANKSDQNMEAFNRLIEPYLTKDFTMALRQENGIGFGIINEEVNMARAIKSVPHIDGCDFLKSPIDIPTFVTSWMYPNNSILQTIFDTYWLEIDEHGVFDQIDQRYDIHTQFCQANDTAAVNFSFVMLLFIILAVGIGIALIIFFLEKLGTLF